MTDKENVFANPAADFAAVRAEGMEDKNGNTILTVPEGLHVNCPACGARTKETPEGIFCLDYLCRNSETSRRTAKTEVKTDEVNHPAHYTQGGIECIAAIEAALTPEEFRGYCKGNAIKYLWRMNYKGGKQSLEKAMWYMKRLLGKE